MLKVLIPCPPGGGALPSNRLMGMHSAGWGRFTTGLAIIGCIVNRATRMGSHIFGILGYEYSVK